MGEPRGESVTPCWDYWCPVEDTHVVHPQELWVGIVSVDDAGMGLPLFVAAIVPPLPRDQGFNQNEPFAHTIRDALAAGPWLDPDGLVAGLRADGVSLPFPPKMPGGSDG